MDNCYNRTKKSLRISSQDLKSHSDLALINRKPKLQVFPFQRQRSCPIWVEMEICFVYRETLHNRPDETLASLFLWSRCDTWVSVSVEGPRAQLHSTPRALASAVQRGRIPQDQGPHQDGENARVLAQIANTAAHQKWHKSVRYSLTDCKMVKFNTGEWDCFSLFFVFFPDKRANQQALLAFTLQHSIKPSSDLLSVGWSIFLTCEQTRLATRS